MGTEAIPICSSEPEPEVLHKSKELPNTSKNLKHVWGVSRHYIILIHGLQVQIQHSVN